MPFVRRTRATLRSAEFGFFGVIVETRVHTPRFCGAPSSAGVFVFSGLERRPFLINWLTVGMELLGKRSHKEGRRDTKTAPTNPGRHGTESGAEASNRMAKRVSRPSG